MKSVTVSIFPSSICQEVMWLNAMIFTFWMLSFKPAFSLSSFTYIKRLFSSFSLSANKVVSSAYLRLLIFLLAIFIPAYESSSPAFHTMYSAYQCPAVLADNSIEYQFKFAFSSNRWCRVQHHMCVDYLSTYLVKCVFKTFAQIPTELGDCISLLGVL